ncbi:MAG: DUF5784 family protein [Halodesulfurarchaeum sp.]
MASLLRFRYSPSTWSTDSVTRRIYQPLDSNLGAEMGDPWFRPPDGYEAKRFDMENGDVALFAWNDREAYWLGNTETPEALWRTDKVDLDDAPFEIGRWAQRELLAHLHERTPWLESYPNISWFFLPVFLSKDGRESSVAFFSKHTAGFPETNRKRALSFYEDFLETGVLNPYRHVMAGKVGTSTRVNVTRMTAAMGEFNTAYLLYANGHDFEPEAAVSTGHSIDFRVEQANGSFLVEVTRPAPPRRRNTNSPKIALRQTASTKTEGQLDAHGGGVVLLVDCSSFTDEEWDVLASERPDVGHKPAVVYRLRPDGSVSGYSRGSVPIELAGIVDGQ